MAEGVVVKQLEAAVAEHVQGHLNYTGDCWGLSGQNQHLGYLAVVAAFQLVVDCEEHLSRKGHLPVEAVVGLHYCCCCSNCCCAVVEASHHHTIHLLWCLLGSHRILAASVAAAVVFERREVVVGHYCCCRFGLRLVARY